MKSDEARLRENVLHAVREYHDAVHAVKKEDPEGRIPYAGRVYDAEEMVRLVDAALDFWLTAGRYAASFEERLASFLGVKASLLVNSGSSANLLAFMALTSPLLGERRICPGDEVITLAAAFPTTVAPIVQYGAVPVFVDVSLPTYNLDCSWLEQALSSRTKAVMVAHTLGNPFDVAQVIAFCRQHELWLIEDNCDALGSRYVAGGVPRLTGSFGHVATCSFYPPHHITMGEGGAVCTDDPLLRKILASLRDWGRDCTCRPGEDGRCGRRFSEKWGDLPLGYDHKYVYSHFGYNMKVTELQAAVGCAQLDKLPRFIEARKANFAVLRNALADLEDIFILPEATSGTDPSWFGFLLTVRPQSGVSREHLVTFLEQKGIQTRMLFAGNLLRHPCFDEMRRKNEGFRVVGSLENTDLIAENTFWIGVYPGMTDAMLYRMVREIRRALRP